MTLPAVSVVVASRHRPALLLRALTALALQDHDRIEVIVVADPAAARAVLARGRPARVVPFDVANLSAARNEGIRRAAAPVVAFLDDDAVPEPTWAGRLAAPFAHPRVVQAAGFVRGSNGISYQWRAMEVDAEGRDHPLAVPQAVSLHEGSARRAVKTQGTNCAFRRTALLAAGGFDPVFRFFLDDADLNLRLAARGGLTAVVPDAEVQHGFAASARRRGDRAPLCLRDIGASSAIFLRRHAPGRIGPRLEEVRAEQRRRLLAAMMDGRLEPRDVGRLMESLENGIAEGTARPLGPPPPLVPEGGPFAAMPGTGPRPGHMVAVPPSGAGAPARAAAAALAEGAVVTVLRLGLWPARHRAGFDPAGFWWQSGGLLTRSDRADPPLSFWRAADRIAREAARIAPVRPTGTAGASGCLSARQHGDRDATQGYRIGNVV